jgi:predicted RNA methylase
MIDWQNDDGVNLPMICDFMRNQFYEDIIANNVQGKTVLDVGFGTGLLSIIALKHGAKQVIAYERNKARYELGLDIIERCNLQDKIKLLNKKFRAPCISDHSIDVIVT